MNSDICQKKKTIKKYLKFIILKIIIENLKKNEKNKTNCIFIQNNILKIIIKIIK